MHLEQLLMVLRTNIIRHRHRLMDGIRDLLAIPWVHNDRTVQTLSGTSKLGDDQRALAFLLTRDVLIRNLQASKSTISEPRE